MKQASQGSDRMFGGAAPHGNDADPGTSPGRAVATLGQAQRLVRSLDAGMHGDITVELESGTYRLTQPLTLGAQDRSA
jgi:hypothetical protein